MAEDQAYCGAEIDQLSIEFQYDMLLNQQYVDPFESHQSNMISASSIKKKNENENV